MTELTIHPAVSALEDRLAALEARTEPLPRVTLRTSKGEGAYLPTRAHLGDAGWDLRALEPVFLHVNAIRVVRTGVYADLPPGTYGMMCSRSGLAAKHGVIVANAPGIIDSGYSGELLVTIANLGRTPYRIERGDRIAQIVFGRNDLVMVSGGDTLESDSRGDGGHGSSGR